jgi:hypothetical protein
VAELKAATFFDFYKRITNFEAIVSLRTDSGSMMLRSPFEERWLSISLADAKSMARIRAGAEEGAFEEISHLTGEPLLFSYKRLDKWSLVAVYARRMDDVLAPWRSRTENRILLATGILGFILIALIAFLVYYRYQRRLDHALSSSEYRYRKLYEEGSDPIVLISSELRYLDCNAAALRFFGVPDKERIIGRKVGCSRARKRASLSSRISMNWSAASWRTTPAVRMGHGPPQQDHPHRRHLEPRRVRARLCDLRHPARHQRPQTRRAAAERTEPCPAHGDGR